MNISSFSTLSAIALTGLAFTFGSSNACAHSNSRCSSGHSSHGHSSRGSHCSTGRGHGHCSSLPRGCRPTRYRGERCWYGGGNYYRCAPTGGYICINAAPVTTEYVNVVERPVVQRRVIETEVVEQEDETIDDGEEEAVSYLPTGCTTVYVGGERCWYSNGCYYRHCGRGYTKFHCGNRGGHGHGGRTCSSHHTSSHGRTCGTSSHHSSSRGRTCSTGRGHSSHSSSHGSHSSSSHGSHGGHSSHGHR